MSLSTMNDDTGTNNVSKEILDPSIVITPKISNPWTVDKALAAITFDKPMEDSSSPVPFFHILERLKTTKREGWRRFGINGGESIADHMYRMSLMTMLGPASLTSRLDLFKCMKMCLIHDMAELLVGDITPADGVPKREKIRRETLTMDYITQHLLGNVQGAGASIVGTEIRALWQEHEDSETLESRFVQDIDKVELLLQMVEYEKRGGGRVDLSEFTYVATKVSLPETKAWAEEILQERDRVWSGKLVAGEAGEVSSGSSQLRKLQDQYYDGES
ncbi:putative HD family hydrolase [Patellaria atrata CBS 101060]|uniref:5'-deoxynucleotidase n=1 Tax=Patellaria atrata CBS 101060 TaxID=1346257 RepID=A0A9P4VLI3_9PEZI|nr:putative HD family hydrolase [Patellaria atrata CBS 101060]